jgi:mannose-6-phosphate isomerase-like protein (cupin superfamily)
MTDAGITAPRVQRIDPNLLAGLPAGERVVQQLINASTGSGACTISCILTPAGGGSPEGRHVHAVDQIFYVISGTMSIEVEDEAHEVGPGSLVVFPAGVPHRNWNAGGEPTVHLAINTPAPDPSVPFATRVD